MEAVSMCEFLLERISYEQDIDPVKVRLLNVDTAKHNDIKDMYDYLEKKSDYKERRVTVDKFNLENRWRKRGLRVSFMRWEPVGGQRLHCSISVYHEDGTVAIVHSGIEMGQGINTKAIQIAAYKLKISTEFIKIKGNNTISGLNAFITGGSVASQNVGIAVVRACEDLETKMEPVKSQNPNATWKELVKLAYDSDIDLQGNGSVGFSDAQQYSIYGVAMAEVEVDILTGQTEIRRVDLIEDAGRPVNPEVDIGQVSSKLKLL